MWRRPPRPWSGTLNLRVINKEGTEYGPGQGDRAQPAGLGWREVTATDGVWGQASLGSGGWMQGLWGGPGRSCGAGGPQAGQQGARGRGRSCALCGPPPGPSSGRHRRGGLVRPPAHVTLLPPLLARGRVGEWRGSGYVQLRAFRLHGSFSFSYGIFLFQRLR